MERERCRRELAWGLSRRTVAPGSMQPRSASPAAAGARRVCAGRKWPSAPISRSTWYTWLEQGRGGAPSADVARPDRARVDADRCRARAPVPDRPRPPARRCATQASEGVSRRGCNACSMRLIQPGVGTHRDLGRRRLNRAASVVLTDYGAIPPGQRNILRFIFCDPRVRAAQYDWDSVARLRGGRIQGRRGASRVPSRMSPISSTSSAGQVRNSRRSGATMTCAIMATAPSGCGIPFTARCRSNIRASMSRAAPISA